jgi:hypothetical protein
MNKIKKLKKVAIFNYYLNKYIVVDRRPGSESTDYIAILNSLNFDELYPVMIDDDKCELVLS